MARSSHKFLIAEFFSMRSNTLICQTFLPLESVKLGRLVVNVDEPQQDYLDPVGDFRAEIIVKPQARYEDAQESGIDKNFTTLLTGLASASRTKRNKIFSQVTTDQVTTYQLANSGLWFKNAIKTDAARKWIEEAIDQGDDVFVIVGYHTMLDAQIVEGVVATREVSGRLKIPVTESLAAAGVVIPIGDIVNPGIAGHDQHQEGVQRRFVATGEQICAVQYRKLQFKWFSSRDLDTAALGKENRWKVYWNGVRGQESGTKDVLEADLQDELDLEQDREKYSLEGESTFFL